MIATILPSSTTFHAVDYRSSSARLLPKGRKNEHKVSEGVAELLEIRGFDLIDQQYTPDELKQQLLNYTYQYNERIKKPQFHLAISCRGNEYTYEQLLDIAHQYLKEMGYGEDGQPLLIYAHHDTDNHHLHIVTSRIAPDGHKIDHNQERIRSQEDYLLPTCCLLTANRLLTERCPNIVCTTFGQHIKPISFIRQGC